MSAPVTDGIPNGYRLTPEEVVYFTSLAGRGPGVYALTNPLQGDAIAYVGSALIPLVRYLQHLRAGSQCPPLVAEWVLALFDQGLRPGFTVLEWVDAGLLLKQEHAWLKLLAETGQAELNRQGKVDRSADRVRRFRARRRGENLADPRKPDTNEPILAIQNREPVVRATLSSIQNGEWDLGA